YAKSCHLQIEVLLFVVGRALAQALQQEFAASQAAAGTWGRAGHQCAAASSLPSLRLWEAQQVLSASKLSRKEIQKSYEHLFKVNNRSIGGSFYLQSKVVRAKEDLSILGFWYPMESWNQSLMDIQGWLNPRGSSYPRGTENPLIILVG
uniref:Mitochondria-associated granulocyte macrophage CSF-signaling molecule n=1 Tax=Capra hircus TaxID=9925 RepID=A0A8C2NYE2_CAPHI